jgi:hypothetical protein
VTQLWIWIFLANVVWLVWLGSGALASYAAGLRGQDKLDGLKTGLLLGPIGVASVVFRKPTVPDMEMRCPQCGTLQDVGGNLEWFACWKCGKESDGPTRS